MTTAGFIYHVLMGVLSLAGMLICVFGIMLLLAAIFAYVIEPIRQRLPGWVSIVWRWLWRGVIAIGIAVFVIMLLYVLGGGPPL